MGRVSSVASTISTPRVTIASVPGSARRTLRSTTTPTIAATAAVTPMESNTAPAKPICSW